MTRIILLLLTLTLTACGVPQNEVRVVLPPSYSELDAAWSRDADAANEAIEFLIDQLLECEDRFISL